VAGIQTIVRRYLKSAHYDTYHILYATLEVASIQTSVI